MLWYYGYVKCNPFLTMGRCLLGSSPLVRKCCTDCGGRRNPSPNRTSEGTSAKDINQTQSQCIVSRDMYSSYHHEQTRRHNRDPGSAMSGQQDSPAWLSTDALSQSPPSMVNMTMRGRSDSTTSRHAPSSWHFRPQGSTSGSPVASPPQSTLAAFPQSQPSAPVLLGPEPFSAWMAFLPNIDIPSEFHSRPPLPPSFAHSGMKRASPAEHMYLPAYERSHLPTWNDQQYSGELRRRELEATVTREDYVHMVHSPAQSGSGSQGSRGSTGSNSTGGATAGSYYMQAGHVSDSECEFCGRRGPVSTLKEHWFICEHRNPVPESRQGPWIQRRRC